jgi:hypothetical protein
MLVGHIQGAFMQFFRKILRIIFFFFRKCNFIKTGTCQFETKTQKQTIFRRNLLGKIYSTLYFLSNGIQYMKLFLLLIGN